MRIHNAATRGAARNAEYLEASNVGSLKDESQLLLTTRFAEFCAEPDDSFAFNNLCAAVWIHREVYTALRFDRKAKARSLDEVRVLAKIRAENK